MACSTGAAGTGGIAAGTVATVAAAPATGDGERPRLPASAASPAAAGGGASVADAAGGDVPRTASGSVVGGAIVRLAGESGAAATGTDAVPAVPAVGGVGGVGDCAGTDPLARVVSPVGPDEGGGGGDAILLG